MNEYIILTANPLAYVPSQYRALVQVQMLGTDTVLNITHSANPVLPGDSLVAATNPFTGLPVAPTDEDLYLQIRPLGNDAGQATGPLGYHGWAGTPVRVLGDPDATYEPARLYPGPDIPFDAEARHKYFSTPATPSSTGWGFRYELIGKAETRDPSARAIGVYSDPECTQYLWTTGALQLGNSDWQTDDLGNPIEVWYTDSWDGDRPDDQKDWHIAMLLGSAQEGHQTLPIGSDGIRYLFWEFDQGYEPPPVGQWVDTSATIIAQAGTVYRISDAVVAAALIPGQAIRLGDTAETTFTGVWAGGADYIEIDPFVQASVGDAVWEWK